VAETHDVVFFNYTVLDWAYAAMGCFVHGMGKKLIMDLDDALWYVNPDNIAYSSLKKVGGRQILTSILRDVDGVTATTLYLKHLINHETGISYDKMQVVPNCIDLNYYKYKFEPKDQYKITLFYYGSTSHFNDLLEGGFVEGMTRIFADYPNVVFRCIGANIPELKMKWGERYTYGWGHSDVYKWISEKFPVYMKEADIMVVPLGNNIYNRCKSDIKFIETATTATPGVFQKMLPYTEYIQHGETGFLAETPEEWYRYIKILIDSKEERRRIGENAYKYVVENRQIQQLIPTYARFILTILNKGV